MSEVELAQHFVKYLSDFDLYFEAPPHHVDIVAISGKKRIAVEVKKQFNFKVIEQAYRNTHWFHLSYIAVPLPRRSPFSLKICEDYGIGVLTFDERLYKINPKSDWLVHERIKPRFNKIPKPLLDHCNYEQYMKKSIPGSSGTDGAVITAFKMTVWELEKWVKHHPGCTMKEAIENIDHHYSSFAGAKSSLYQHIRNGIIDTVELKDRKLYLINKSIQEEEQ